MKQLSYSKRRSKFRQKRGLPVAKPVSRSFKETPSDFVFGYLFFSLLLKKHFLIARKFNYRQKRRPQEQLLFECFGVIFREVKENPQKFMLYDEGEIERELKELAEYFDFDFNDKDSFGVSSRTLNSPYKIKSNRTFVKGLFVASFQFLRLAKESGKNVNRDLIRIGFGVLTQSYCFLKLVH